MKTDRELLELAAKAAGIDAGWHCPEDEIEDQADDLAKSEGMWLKGARSPDNSKYWNPLIDDGDAFRLGVKLRITINQDVETNVQVHWRDGVTSLFGHVDLTEIDRITATRRAIVLAAAEVGSGTS